MSKRLRTDETPRHSGAEIRFLGSPNLMKRHLEPREAAIKKLSNKSRDQKILIHKLKTEIAALKAVAEQGEHVAFDDPFDELELLTSSLQQENEELKKELASEKRSALRNFSLIRSPDSLRSAFQSSLSGSKFKLNAVDASAEDQRTTVMAASSQSIKLDGSGKALDFKMHRIAFKPQANPIVFGVGLTEITARAGDAFSLVFIAKTTARPPLSVWIRHSEKTDRGLTVVYDLANAAAKGSGKPSFVVNRRDTDLELADGWLYPLGDGYSLCSFNVHCAKAVKLRLSLHIREGLYESHLMELQQPAYYEIGFPAKR